MESRVVVVGDMHVVADELMDCNAVINLILDVCRVEEIKEVWFTGDQFHNHDLVQVAVLHWWLTAFKALRDQGINSVCLVGNHDQSSPGSITHAMMAFTGLSYVKVIDKPMIHRGVLMVPYVNDEQAFVEACKVNSRAATVFCHQTFDGSIYENGFLASDGFQISAIPQELVISGHIHTGQEFSKVWYIGAPRWRRLDDANVERAIWALKFNDAGQLVDRRPFSTGEVCRQIKHVTDTPETPIQTPLDLRHQWRVDVKGPADWCQKRKTELHLAGARVRTFPEQISALGCIKESDGIAAAFGKYLDLYQPRHGTNREDLMTMVRERVGL